MMMMCTIFYLIVVVFYIEKKRDTKYWANPQVYITCDGVSGDLNGPHFILYNFKTNNLLPFDDKLKNLSVMGELKHEVECIFLQSGPFLVQVF